MSNQLETGLLTSGKYVWLPHLILQRGLGVKDLRDVNFTATLNQAATKEVKMWQPKENKPNLLTQVQGLTGPNRKGNESLIDDKRGQDAFFYKGARPSHIMSQEIKDGQIIDTYERGEMHFFTYKGYATFLFQDEFALIEEVLPLIQEITIHTTSGLSPLFKVQAVLKKD